MSKNKKVESKLERKKRIKKNKNKKYPDMFVKYAIDNLLNELLVGAPFYKKMYKSRYAYNKY